jgi:hypothetical protein
MGVTEKFADGETLAAVTDASPRGWDVIGLVSWLGGSCSRAILAGNE